jgi:hypothetical protein
MSFGPRGPRRRRPSGTSAALAEAWAGELRAAGLLQLTTAELELLLRSQAEVLIRTLHAKPFVPDPARQVGAYLVELQAMGPDALQRTFLLLANRLLDDSQLTPQAGRHRLDQILGELIAGWAEALHAHVLSAQEELRRALEAARQDPGGDAGDAPGGDAGGPDRPDRGNHGPPD